MTYDLVVIGGGPAGVTAALRARELKKTVCLIERDRLGGVCTNSGCVPMRALAKTAHLLREARRAGELGVSVGPVDLDFARAMAIARGTIETVHNKKNLAAALTASGAELIVGRGAARFISPHEFTLADGTVVSGHSILLAVGGHPHRPDFPGAEHVLLPTDLWSLEKLPARLIVIGSGATGLQAASCFQAFGSEVTILETMPAFAPALDADLSQELQGAFARRDIHVLTNLGTENPARVTKSEAGLGCWIGADRHEADVIFAATGWPANLEPLRPEAAGLKVEKDALVVDEFQRTNVPHIYVAGDADGTMMLVQTAFYEALLATDNALGGASRKKQSTIVPAGGFTDPEYASVGLTEAAARKAHGDDLVIEIARYDELDRAVIDRRTDGLAKLILQRSTRQLLGAHLAGEGSTEIIHIAAAAMAGRTPIEQLATLQFGYPTYASLIGLAARRLTRKLNLPLAFTEPDAKAIPAEWDRKHGT